MKTFKLNNQDLKYTIDQYQTFTDDNFIELELENLSEQENKIITYDDIEVNYNLDQINKDLALLSIEKIKEYLPNNNVVKDIKFIKADRPKYYNYSTDYYIFSITVDEKELEKFVKKHDKTFDEYARKGIMLNNEVDIYSVMFYLDHFYNDEDYKMSIYDQLNEIYYQNSDIKIIN